MVSFLAHDMFICNLRLSHRPFLAIAQFSCIFNPINNKKSELMLMRRAKAYSSLCSQVVLGYLYPFRCNYASAAKNRQKITKTLYF